MSLTPQQQADLFEITKSSNAALDRLEIALLDSQIGLQRQVNDLKAKVEELLARP